MGMLKDSESFFVGHKAKGVAEIPIRAIITGLLELLKSK